MAILWQKLTQDTLYEVRTAGNSVRLYTNGVFHSQYNPNNSVTGNVWDLLSLPVFLFPLDRPLKVLVLGVGGGAVIRQLQEWRGNCDITGIELNKTHLTIARRYFGLRKKHVTLVHDDAHRWVRCQRKPQYDLIIDDLFGHAEGEPQRAIAMTRSWVESLQRLLKPDGVIVANFAERAELLGSAFCACPPMQRAFPIQFQFSIPLYENRIGVFGRSGVSINRFRMRTRSVQALEKARGSKRLKFRVSDLTG